jgi:hypothetical protein
MYEMTSSCAVPFPNDLQEWIYDMMFDAELHDALLHSPGRRTEGSGSNSQHATSSAATSSAGPGTLGCEDNDSTRQRSTGNAVLVHNYSYNHHVL